MANLPIDIHPEAQVEQESIFQWYLERSSSAANAFVTEIEEARNAIQTSPGTWAN